ncbi:hypothetical protein NC653_034517 [Populus alba x Populus x berolinensis]|uniref:Uncharacterized protein n=1 Tax=Populus alba x Populus x berolinensis TaxID=444605 RepID=A0AAD6LQL6_9ROSI|nr:hypothetical protein NC653_034517 [Populus alba x Populus x berolinensis]
MKTKMIRQHQRQGDDAQILYYFMKLGMTTQQVRSELDAKAKEGERGTMEGGLQGYNKEEVGSEFIHPAKEGIDADECRG